MKLKIFVMTAATAAVHAASALPVVEPATIPFTQNGSKAVTINYSLAGDAGVVTVDIQTNATDGSWVSIGGTHLQGLTGDVNRALPGGGAEYRVSWRPSKTWPVVEKRVMRAVVRAWATNAPPPYMVADLENPGTVRYYATKGEVPGGITDYRYKTSCLMMRRIPAANATFRMGAGTAAECNQASFFTGREMPHLVTLSADYYIGVYPVTQRQYYLIHEKGKGSYADVPGGAMPSKYTGADRDVHPVENICHTYLRGSTSWPSSGHTIAASDKGRMIGRARAVTGLELDLPTEAQWEFACRAGTWSVYGNGSDTWTDDIGWISENEGYNGTTREVGLGSPNAWDLYDMHGNVWELCLDWFSENYYASSPALDPPGPESSSENYRSTRGGRFSGPAVSARSASRAYTVHNKTSTEDGFRLACPAVVPVQ